MSAAVECELGCVGGLSDGDNHVDENKYTDPELARDFVEKTGADFLAVSIGTLHGVYDKEPKLDLYRLSTIRRNVDVPLVLHGGSGLSGDNFRETILRGICKVNVYTDIIKAARKIIIDSANESYPDMMKIEEDEMKNTVIKRLTSFLMLK